MLPEKVIPENEVHTRQLSELLSLLQTDYRTSYHRTTLDKMQIYPDGRVEGEGWTAPYTQGFLEAVAGSINMPLKYACRLDFELFQRNFEYRKLSCSKGLAVCMHRGVAVNIADAEYRPATTHDVLESFGTNEGDFVFQQALISDRGIEMGYLSPTLSLEPEPGDVIRVGIRISNSETGYRGLKASQFSLRLVCSNGAVMADRLGTARWSYDCRISYRASISKFQKDVRKLRSNNENLGRLYQGILERRLLDLEFCQLWRRLRNGLAPDQVDVILGVPPEERRTIQQEVRIRSTEQAPRMTPWRVYGVHNRITAAAHRYGFVVRTRLERTGGELLHRVCAN